MVERLLVRRTSNFNHQPTLTSSNAGADPRSSNQQTFSSTRLNFKQ